MTFGVIYAHGAKLETSPRAPFSYYATDPTLSWHGAISTEDATGVITVRGETYNLQHDELDVDGTLEATFASGLRPDAPLGSTIELGGDAKSVTIAGTRLTTPAATAGQRAGAAEASGGILLLALLAYAFRHLWLVPLYSRINDSRVLSHPNRQRVYAAVSARASSRVADLVRDTALARPIVRHHLNILKAHGYVVARRADGRLVYALPATASSTTIAASRLDAGPRRRVAELVAQSETALTQRDITRAIGISQRLTCYHLGRLEEAGLVTRTPGKPSLYSASDQLREVVAASPQLDSKNTQLA